MHTGGENQRIDLNHILVNYIFADDEKARNLKIKNKSTI